MFPFHQADFFKGVYSDYVKTEKVDNPTLKKLQDIADDSYGIT